MVTGRRRSRDVLPGRPKTTAALAYAERQHAGQRRSCDGAPFILHPREVAGLLYEAGAPDEVIAAGALHDTIEKTDTTAAELRAVFGAKVSRLVLAVSEDDSITGYEQRKQALREQVASAGDEALMVFAADKISKARELRMLDTANDRSSPRARERRLAHYRRCLDLLEAHLRDSTLLGLFRGEMEGLTPVGRKHVLRTAA